MLGIFRFKIVVLVAQCLARGALLVGEIGEAAGDLAKAVVVTVGMAGIDSDPLPALGRHFIGDRLQLLRDQAVEKRHVFEPAAIVLGEEVAQHRAAGLLIGVHADEAHALVVGWNGGLGQELADLPGLDIVGALDSLPDLFWRAWSGLTVNASSIASGMPLRA